MKEVLLSRKVIVFPGLGRLRATRENNIFFVADEGLDIYPEGFGLQSLSLKTHKETEQELSSAMDEIGDILASAPAAEPVPAASAEATSEATPETVVAEASEAAPEPVADRVIESVQEPAIESVQEPIVAEPVMEQTTELPAEPTPESTPESTPELMPNATHEKHLPKAWKTALIAVLSTAAVAALLLGTYLLLARFCPDFIDSILYTAEELEILNYPL